eukprot:5996058-Amphidinium_carterae.1
MLLMWRCALGAAQQAGCNKRGCAHLSDECLCQGQVASNPSLSLWRDDLVSRDGRGLLSQESGMQPDIVAVSTAVSALQRGTKWAQALALLEVALVNEIVKAYVATASS